MLQDRPVGSAREERRERPSWLRVVDGAVRAHTATPTAVERPSDAYRLGTETGGRGQHLQLPLAARLRHLYVTGMPGTGKSTLLMNLVLHDLQTGVGCLLLDPHGGLVDLVLERCSDDPAVAERIVVVDVADRHRPVGIDLVSGCSEDEQDQVVQFFLGMFRGMYLEAHQGPMFFQAVRNGLLVLMAAGRPLAEFPLLFTDEEYLERVLQSEVDPFARAYFEKTWSRMEDFHQSEALAYFTSKFSPFFDDRLMRNVVGQKGGLDLDDALATGKCVLVNLARGRIGDLSAAILGQVLLHLMRRAAMRRDPARSSGQFHVYVDEAHEFAGGELREMITALRKFRVGVTLANQSVEDFSPFLRDTLLGSTATYIVFRQGFGAFPVEKLVAPFFDESDLRKLADHHAVAVTALDSWKGARIVRLAAPAAGNPERAARLREISAARYGRPRAEVEAELLSPGSVSESGDE